MTAGDNAVLMFLTLFALYSPIAALPAYFPIVGRLGAADQRRLAVGLFLYVAVIVVVTLWVGEVLLEVLGISTAALTATGGIALMFEAVPLMLGRHDAPDTEVETAPDHDTHSWRSVLLMPVTFPLTIGGATVGVLVAFAATSQDLGDRFLLTASGLAYSAVTGLTLFASAHVHRRASVRAREMLDRIAGILLTAIAVTLVVSGGTRLVVEVLNSID